MDLRSIVKDAPGEIDASQYLLGKRDAAGPRPALANPQPSGWLPSRRQRTVARNTLCAKPRGHLVVIIAVMLASQWSALAYAAEAASGRDSILQGYKSADEAYSRSDAAGMVAPIADNVVLDDGQGKQTTVTREQLEGLAAKEFQQKSGDHVHREEHTTIDSLKVEGDHATVGGTVVQELSLQTADGTTANVLDRIGFIDEWSMRNGAWKIEKTKRTSFKRTSSGAPSPTAMAQLRAMRGMNAQLRGFNASNNQSYCMNANQNQQLDYGTRLERCSN